MALVLPCPEDRALTALSDHLLEDILLRIGAPVDLARAAAACKTFRRLIADSAFLRRYRSLHPPMLLGFVGTLPTVSFFPADAPHPNAPAARAADFAFYHCLPHRVQPGWRRCDAHDGRVLLMCSDFDRGFVSPELAVCDPLTWGYTLLPPIPDDLLVSVQNQLPDRSRDSEFFNALFDPWVGKEEAQFRVMCWRHCAVLAAVFVYSSVSGSWTHGTTAWAAIGLDVPVVKIPLMSWWHGYAYGCVYWDAGISNKMIKLDVNSMEFTTVSLPSGYENRNTIFAEAGEGRIGMFSFIHYSENPWSVCYSIRQNESQNAKERAVESKIQLPGEYNYYHFKGSAQGYIFLVGLRGDPPLESAYFSLEIKTLKIERVSLSDCASQRLDFDIIPYHWFPSFMSPRRI